MGDRQNETGSTTSKATMASTTDSQRDGALYVSAMNPDTPTTPTSNVVRQLAHTGTMLLIAGVLLVFGIWVPMRGDSSQVEAEATVMVVGHPLAEIRAPDVSGVFHVREPMTNGQGIRNGMVLGSIESPPLVAQIQLVRAKSTAIQSRMLAVQQQLRIDDNLDSRHRLYEQLRELASSSTETSLTLRRLETLEQQLRIVVPQDGFIHLGMSGSTSVKPLDVIASYSPVGASLYVQITARMDVINRLETMRIIEVEFVRGASSIEVILHPIVESTRSFKKHVSSRGEETWATLTCEPLSSIDQLRPGQIGSLK